MFRAAYRSASGAPNCTCSLWFIYTCGARPLSRLGGPSKYVAACVCHLCVFGVLVCWWSACSQADHQQTRTPNKDPWRWSWKKTETCRDFILTNTLFGVLLCWWSAREQADHQQTRTSNTHGWHTHTATYCVIIQTQRTQIGGRNSNSTKHSGGPPEDGREKRII